MDVSIIIVLLFVIYLVGMTTLLFKKELSKSKNQNIKSSNIKKNSILTTFTLSKRIKIIISKYTHITFGIFSIMIIYIIMKVFWWDVTVLMTDHSYSSYPGKYGGGFVSGITGIMFFLLPILVLLISWTTIATYLKRPSYSIYFVALLIVLPIWILFLLNTFFLQFDNFLIKSLYIPLYDNIGIPVWLLFILTYFTNIMIPYLIIVLILVVWNYYKKLKLQ